MHDFGKIVYLEMQKTGSTFVNSFLRECCLLEEISYKKHGVVRDDYASDKFYFITIRHPYDLYSSLYRYGLDGRGGVYKGLKELGKSTVYASFDSFIEFVADPKNAVHLDARYNEEIAKQLGFMSFRFMRLSLQFPEKLMTEKLSSGESLLELEGKFITNLEMKNEKLNDELLRLSTELFPDIFDREKVAKFIDSTPRINASNTLNDDKLCDDREKFLAHLETKETLLLSRYSES